MRSVLVFALMTFQASAVLAATPADPRANVPTFTQANIIAAAHAINFQAEARTVDGAKIVAIAAPNGLKFTAQPVTCQKPDQIDCYGLSLSVVFSGWNPSLEQVNYFNKHRSFTKAYLDKADAVLSRYEIADYGIPLGNISSNIANFAAIAGQFKQFLNSGATGASHEPPADTRILSGAFGGMPKSAAIGESEPEPVRDAAYINHR